MRILLPIHLDRWRFSIATIAREVCLRIPEMSFYSFSKPASEEDRAFGKSIWASDNLHRIDIGNVFSKTFDLVHLQSSTNRNLAAAFLARIRSFGGCKHLLSAQVEPFRDDPWYRQYRVSVLSAHKITAVSRAVANGVRQHFGRSVDAIIPNGVNLEFFSRDAAEEVDFDKLGFHPPFVVFAGNLERRKRPDIFIELSRLFPEVSFVMMGSFSAPKERDHYITLIRQRPNIKHLGLLPRGLLRNVYSLAAALIFPSEIEGHALAAIEAQAMGLPILAQPKTCMPEVVDIGTTGWLLPVENLSGWAAKLKEILNWSTTERTVYAARSRAVTARRYSWDVIAPQYREMYIACSKQ